MMVNKDQELWAKLRAGHIPGKDKDGRCVKCGWPPWPLRDNSDIDAVERSLRKPCWYCEGGYPQTVAGAEAFSE